jgi:hypothetical protein
MGSPRPTCVAIALGCSNNNTAEWDNVTTMLNSSLTAQCATLGLGLAPARIRTGDWAHPARICTGD